MNYYQGKKEYFQKLYWKNKKLSIVEINGNLAGSLVDLKNKSDFIISKITQAGNILDMGCGNAFLLRIICRSTPYKLVPFGVDFLEESIEQAKKKILPNYRENMIVANVMEFQSKEKFEYILIDPESVSDEDIVEYIEKCRSLLSPTGKIITILHPDSKERLKIREKTLPYIESIGKEYKKGNIYFIIFS